VSQTKQAVEKRRTKRVLPAPDQPVLISMQLERCPGTVHATNISQYGMGISLPEDFKTYGIETSVRVEVALPEPVNEKFTAMVKIVHQQDSNYGVRFEEIAKQDEVLLLKYIDHRLENADGTSVMKALYGI